MEWRNLFSENILDGGQDYVDNNAVHHIYEQEGYLMGDVSGLEEYHVKIKIADNSTEG